MIEYRHMNHYEKQVVGSPTTCVVCEMSLKDQPTTESREYQSEIYTFCSKECAEKFLENPDSFTEDEEGEIEE